jgi:putative transposase
VTPNKRGQGTLLLPLTEALAIIAAMPRAARDSLGGYCYHVLNRGNCGLNVFRKVGDYTAFMELICEAGERVGVRLLAFCLMPNHFHLALWPRRDGDLSDYMMWLTTAHVRRYHQQHQSSGHVWHGRFRAFPIQENDHLLTVHRFIESNPVRSGLVKRAEDWQWSSAAPDREGLPVLTAGPVRHPADWLRFVNKPLTDADIEAMRECIHRRRPYGNPLWTRKTATKMGLGASLRPRGRPPKQTVW